MQRRVGRHTGLARNGAMWGSKFRVAIECSHRMNVGKIDGDMWVVKMVVLEIYRINAMAAESRCASC